MIKLGDIFYVKPDTAGHKYDRIPMIVFEIRENFYSLRFVIPGKGYHGECVFSLDEMRHYFER